MSGQVVLACGERAGVCMLWQAENDRVQEWQLLAETPRKFD